MLFDTFCFIQQESPTIELQTPKIAFKNSNALQLEHQNESHKAPKATAISWNEFEDTIDYLSNKYGKWTIRKVDMLGRKAFLHLPFATSSAIMSTLYVPGIKGYMTYAGKSLAVFAYD